MRKLYLLLFALIALALPCRALAATVSGTLNQRTAHYIRPLEKITVTLESEDGKTVQDATDSEGNYRFTGVSQGRYRIKVKLPSDHVPALMDADNKLLPGQSSSAQTDWFEVSGNTTVSLASTRSTVFIRLIAFVDENANGGRMSSEELLKDVQVSLYPAGHPEMEIASGVTDRKGDCTFNSLSPGSYQVKVVLPDNYSVGPMGSKINMYYNCIQPSDSQEAWSDVVTVTTGSLGMGIGAVATGSAKGLVWYDADHNTSKDASEGGLEGVTVTLTALDSGLTRTAVTDRNGAYSFIKLQPGQYTVQVKAPQGYMFTAKGGDSWLTSDDSDTDQGTVTVVAEQTLTIPTVGLMDATSLMIAFYQDQNANGTQDSGEAGFAAARVSVVSNGAAVAEMRPDANGVATIPIIRAGDVQITATLETSDIFSASGTDNDFALTLAGSQSLIALTLKPGETTVLRAAVTQAAQMAGLLFMDHNDNGIMDGEDTPAPGHTVQAVDWNGQIVAETVTDSLGGYLFERLLPIPHTVRFLLNDPYIASPYAEAANKTTNSVTHQTAEYGETELIHLTPGSFTGEINGALFQAGTLSGRILLTDDRPAGMSGGLDGVIVTLTTLDGEPVSDYTQAVSETDGTYYLKGILPGEYQLNYQLPADSLFVETDALSVNSVPFTSAMGSDIQMADIYAVRTATIEGQVLCDGEPADAVITAVNQDTGYTLSFPAESASGGHFALRLLRPGTWHVTVTLEEGFSFAEDTALVPPIAWHISSQDYTFAMGDALTGQNVLVTRPATMTGRIFLDEDLSGTFGDQEKPFAGAAIALINRNGETVAELTTDDDGRFASPKLIPGVYQVALTLDEDTILPDGFQLSETQWAQEVETVSGRNTEAAVPVMQFASVGGKLWSLDGSLDFVGGIEVALYRADDPATPIAVTKTDKNGAYRFVRLYPGTYTLSAVLPDGHGYARRSDTDETHVSLVLSNDEDTMSDALQLRMGTIITNADFGFGAKGSIGDLAWLDENGNGMQDIGERGIPGIKLQLWQDDELLAETETDIYGHYMFENIYPGRYTLRVTMHPELKATVHQTTFPLIGSVLPEEDGLTVDATEIIVPSGTRNLAVDVGFVLRKAGLYPAVMDTIPTTDWSFGGKRR